MNKPITKSDGLYKESLAWMSYRYAMGMTDYVGRKSYSELERYRQFMDIEFGSRLATRSVAPTSMAKRNSSPISTPGNTTTLAKAN